MSQSSSSAQPNDEALDGADTELRSPSTEPLVAALQARNAELEQQLQALTQEITERKLAETTLQRSEQQMRAILDRIHDAFFALDSEGCFVYLNPRAADLLCHSAQDLIGRNLWQVFPELVGSVFDEQYRWAMTQQQSVSFEAYYAPFDVWYEVQADPCEGGLSVCLREISDRRQAEVALRESEARLRAVFDQAAVGIFLQEVESGRYVEVNARLCEMLGYTSTELCDRTWQDLTHPEDFRQERPLDRRLLSGQISSVVTEKRYLCQDGSYRWITLSLSMIRDAIGTPLYKLGLVIDIEDRKQAEFALQRLNQDLERRVEERTAHLQLALSAASMGIWEWDMVTQAQMWSAQECQLLGFQLDAQGQIADLTGQVVAQSPSSELFLSRVHPADRASVKRRKQEALAHRSSFESEYRVVWADGSEHWIYSRGAYIFDEQGQPLKALGVDMDLSDRKRTEEILRQSEAQLQAELQERRQIEEQLRASLKEKEVLLREVHHRVKNNLQLIYSLLRLQTDGIKDPTTLTLFKESQQRVRAMALIHERLYQSKNFAQINVSTYIRDLSRDIFQSYRMVTTPVTLNLEITDLDLPIDVAIPCGLIMNELISNALKYAFPRDRHSGFHLATPHEIRIQLSLDECDRCVLIIADNGIGLPPEINAKTARTLGLQLVQGLSKQLGATLEIQRDQGTQFKLVFAL